MARPRLPSLYGYLQWSLRLIILVAEACAVGALVFLAKDGYVLAIGFITSIIGVLFEMAELVAISNSTYMIKRTPPVWLVAGDFLLICLGLTSLLYGVFRYLDWDPGVLDGEKPMSIWASWYLGFQVTAAVLHFVAMMIHCIEFCRNY